MAPWTRALLEADRDWLDVSFNALDENGHAFHEMMPDGCVVPRV